MKLLFIKNITNNIFTTTFSRRSVFLAAWTQNNGKLILEKLDSSIKQCSLRFFFPLIFKPIYIYIYINIHALEKLSHYNN